MLILFYCRICERIKFCLILYELMQTQQRFKFINTLSCDNTKQKQKKVRDRRIIILLGETEFPYKERSPISNKLITKATFSPDKFLHG